MKNPTLACTFAVILLAVIVLLHECHKPQPLFTQKGDTKYITVNSIIHDTFTVPGKEAIKYIPQPYPVLPSREDTLNILANCLAQRIYTDTTNSNGVDIIKTDTVQNNKIKSETLSIKNNRPILESQAAKNKLFAGFSIGYGPVLKPAAFVNLNLITKADHSYTLGYDILNQTITAGMQWKIHLGK